MPPSVPRAHYPGRDVPASRRPAVPPCSTSSARNAPDGDEHVFSRTASVRGRRANHSDGFFCLETAARDGLCAGRAALVSPRGHLDLRCPASSGAERSALRRAAASHCTLRTSGELSHLLRAGIPGTASLSCSCSDDTKPGVCSAAMPGSPRGAAPHRGQRR